MGDDHCRDLYAAGLAMSFQMQHRDEAAGVLLEAALTSRALARRLMCCGVLCDGDHQRATIGGAFACRRAPLTNLRGGVLSFCPGRLMGRSAAQSPKSNLPDLMPAAPVCAAGLFERGVAT